MMSKTEQSGSFKFRYVEKLEGDWLKRWYIVRLVLWLVDFITGCTGGGPGGTAAYTKKRYVKVDFYRDFVRVLPSIYLT